MVGRNKNQNQRPRQQRIPQQHAPRQHGSRAVRRIDPSKRGSNELAGYFLRQLADPCTAPPAGIPDEWHGSATTVITESHTSLGVDSSGDRHIIVNPGTDDKLSLSGVVTYGTFTHVDDPQNSNFAARFKHVRCTGMCAKLTKTSADDTGDGVLSVVNAPGGSVISAYSSVTDSAAFVDEAGAMVAPLKDGVEAIWLPLSSKDLSPHDPSLTFNSSSNEDKDGRKLKERNSLHLLIRGASSTTTYYITVMARYECFYLGDQTAYGARSARQDRRAIDIGMSALAAIKWVSVGSEIGKRAQLATALGTAVGGPAVGAGIGAAAMTVGQMAALAKKLGG